VIHSRNADVPLERVLSLGAFDLERALALDDAFLEPARPFEWAGLYALAPGRHVLQTGTQQHEHEHEHDHAHHHGDENGHDHRAHGNELAQVDVVVLPAPDLTAASIDAQLERASALFESEPVVAAPGTVLAAGLRHRLQLQPGAQFQLEAGVAPGWVLFTEHAPVEFGLQLPGLAPLQQREFGSHHHDLAVGSIGLTDVRPLDPNKVNDWLSYLLQSRGADILRMKGVLNLKGENRRYVFHGVHMVFDGQLERAWSAEAPRRSRLVFIGRNLDRAEFEAGFESCVA
jgi:G3E family GTPase